MPIEQREAMAALRVLIAVAKADGTFRKAEKDAFRTAMSGLNLPESATLDVLLEEEVNLEDQLPRIKSEDARAFTFDSAYTLAHADRECTLGEQKVLDRIKEHFNIPDENVTLLGRLLGEFKDTVLPSNIEPISDTAKREAAVQEDTLKYAIITAVLGAFPIPVVALATDIAVIGIQTKMVRDIGQYWGHRVDDQASRSLLYGVGMGSAVQVAINNLAKFVPFFGSAAVAASNFAATWALGKIADQYFESGGKAEYSTLKDAFETAQKDGELVFQEHQSHIDSKGKEHEKMIQSFNMALKAKQISQAEYQKRIAELAQEVGPAKGQEKDQANGQEKDQAKDQEKGQAKDQEKGQAKDQEKGQAKAE